MQAKEKALTDKKAAADAEKKAFDNAVIARRVRLAAQLEAEHKWISTMDTASASDHAVTEKRTRKINVVVS